MILSALGGVATGLIGNLLTSVTGYFTQRQKNKHDVAMHQYALEERKQEAALEIQVDKNHTDGELAIAETQGFNALLKEANKASLDSGILKKLFENPWTMLFGVLIAFLLGLVDVVKAVIRPALTIYLVALTTYLTQTSIDIISIHDELLSTAEAKAIFMMVLEIILYLTISIVTWWFGDRRTAKNLHKVISTR